MQDPAKYRETWCRCCGHPRLSVRPEWLRDVRTRARLRLDDVAERAGVRKQYVCNVERGLKPCSSKLLAVYEAIDREQYERAARRRAS